MTGVELFTIGATAVTAADALTAIGALAGLAGGISGGQNQAAIAKYNAALADRDAAQARIASAHEESLLRRRTERLAGAQKVAFHKSGITLEGSAIEVLGETYADSELDALAIRHSGSVAEAQARGRAAAERMKADYSRTAGYISGGASLLTGLSKIGARNTPAGTGTNPRFGELLGGV